MMNEERLSVATLFAFICMAGYSVATALASPTVATDGLYCSDRDGYRVQDGVEYMPEADPCKKCQCQSGFPVMCRSVLCSAPTCLMYESLKNECCVFHCIQPSLDMPKNNGNGSNHIYPMLKDVNSVNLSIRLVASAVTSLLIFALLIFMIHRLRQRRLLISMRRLNNDRRSVNDGLDYMTNIDQLDIGFEFPPYEDPPPPYSPPKPFDDIPTEAPPPYESTPSQMETERSEITHTEANVLEVSRSGFGDTTVERPLAVSAAAATRLLAKSRWMDNHSLRPLSAREPLQSELIELNQQNLDSKSAMTLSSPVLIDQNRNEKDCRCQSHRFTNNRRSGELLNAVQRSADPNIPAPSQIQMAVNHSNFCEAYHSSERFTKNLDGFETMCDISNPLNVASVESEVEDDPSETRVKHFSSSNMDFISTEHCNSLMQRSAPEASLFLKSSQVSCAVPRKDKKPLNLIKIRDKDEPFLSNNSFLKKQKYPSRPQSFSGPDLQTNTKRSSFAQNLTSEQQDLLTKPKIKMTEDPSSCLFVHDGPCIHESNAAKKQLLINKGDTTLDDENSLQPLAHDDQSVFNMTTRLEGLAEKQPILENALMAGRSESPVGLLLLSPDLPVYRQFLRSESMTSQASFYSICSETGEKKHTKSVHSNSSKGLSTVSASSGYLLLGDASKKTDMKEHAACIGEMGLSSTGLSMDACINKDSLKNMTSSTLSPSKATSSSPVQGSQSHSLSDWKGRKDHSATSRYVLSTNEIKNGKRPVNNSNNLHVTLADALSFSSSKCLKLLPHDRILECDPLTRTPLAKARSFGQNIVESTEKVSCTNPELCNSGEAKLSYQSCKVSIKPAYDDECFLIFKDQSRQGVEDFGRGHKKHSFYRYKEQLNNGKKLKSKHIESFEYLVSRILHQLETSHVDEFAGPHNTLQRVQRPRRFGRKSTEASLRLSSRSLARPISLPNTKHSSLLEGSISAEPTNLDFANRNRCMLERIGNDNEGPCQQLHHGEHHSSGTSVSVAL